MRFALFGNPLGHLSTFAAELLESGHSLIGVVAEPAHTSIIHFANAHNVPVWPHLSALLRHRIDILGCAVSNDQKLDVIEWCEENEIHVMDDKPIAVTWRDLERLRQVIHRGRIKVGMMLTERFSPSVYTLKQMITNGELGTLYDFTFLKPHRMMKSNRPSWFFDPEIHGGLIVNILIHDIDLLFWFTGQRIVHYDAMMIQHTNHESPGFADYAQVNLRTENSVTALLKTDWLMPEGFATWGDGRIFATGSKGRVEIRSAGDVLGSPGPFITLTTHDQPPGRLKALNPPWTLSEDFVRNIEGNFSILSQEDILRCSETVLSIRANATHINHV